jgi:hypothetical protein
MTSDEIRGEKLNEYSNADAYKCGMLREIAAQLAELNEHFRKADESVFGVKDRT